MENPPILPWVFNIRSKSWFLTYPKCSLTKEDCLAILQSKGRAIKGGVISRELHEDGTPHLHVYLLLEKEYNCKNQKFWDLETYHGNYQQAKSLTAVVKYIKKDGDILEFGDISWTEKLNSQKEHRRYLGKRIINGEPLRDIINDDPSLIFGLRHLTQDIHSWKCISTDMLDKPDVRGIWIYGPPRVGKSHFVRAQESDLFLKSQNKWWDGYSFEKAVLIDDFDKQGTCLSHHLKIWSDRYACSGEVKGGHVPLNYDRFYITSNYSIDDLYPALEDLQLNLAIKGRFKVIHMTTRDLGLTGYLNKIISRSRSKSP